MRVVVVATTGVRATGYLHAKESQLYADILQCLGVRTICGIRTIRSMGMKLTVGDEVVTFEGGMGKSLDGTDVAIEKPSINPSLPYRIHKTSCTLTLGTPI